MSSALFQVTMETAEELIERVVKNHAISVTEKDVSGVPMTMNGGVDTAKGTLYYRLQVSDDPFEESGQNIGGNDDE